MSEIKIDSTLPSSVQPLASHNLHLLPCRIEYNGPAPVSNYFTVTAKSVLGRPTGDAEDAAAGEKGALFESAFRGRHLVGREVRIPEGYEGLIYREDKVNAKFAEEQEEEGCKQWHAGRSFNSFTLWGHDEAPETWNDRFLKGLEWAALSSAIHDPISLPPKSD